MADTDVHALHVVGYSDPVDVHLDRDKLESHLFSLPDRPHAIPYRTSYYNRTWACVSHAVRDARAGHLPRTHRRDALASARSPTASS